MTRQSGLGTSPTVMSLFAGIGGIDLGLERQGCVTRWYSEVDPYACKVMERRFPNAVNIGDVTEIDWTAFNERPDIIAGGFPCQDLSVAGKGAGIDGSRSGLWRYYADAIRALRPELVIVENVSILLARGMGRVLGDLASSGYDAEWDCIPAASVGANHLRARTWLIAYPASERNGVEAQALRAGWPRPIDSNRWASEPGILRVANGVPSRVERLRCIGNAVVPQVAEHVARIALERVA